VLDFTEGIGIIKTYNLLGEKSKDLSDSFREACRVSLQLAVWGEDMDTDFENYLFKLSVKAYYEQAVMPHFGG
jgi:hypothetical protein